MPENGTLTHGPSYNGGITAEVVGETLIFSSDLIKTEFNSEDHVILVVPESTEGLVTCDSVSSDSNGRFIVPVNESSQVSNDSSTLELTPSPNDLREMIKSNFLVITKLLPSKSPPPLIPFVSKTESALLQIKASSRVIENRIEQRVNSTRTHLHLSANRKVPKNPKQSGKHHSAHKQEIPEVFGKMFPVAYNDVLWRQIKDIIHFKGGHGATDDTEIPTGVPCPHCRKKPSTLNLLKQHLNDCHTYSTKRKASCSVSKSPITKKLLYRCQHCSEAFISVQRRDSHECSLLPKPSLLPEEIIQSNPTPSNISSRDIGSRMEISISQEINRVPKPTGFIKLGTPLKKPDTLPSISTYVSCKVCQKKISISVLPKHLMRHEQQCGLTIESHQSAKKCKSCLKMCERLDPEYDACSTCMNADNDSLDAAICPICDIEVPAYRLEKHASTHYSTTADK